MAISKQFQFLIFCLGFYSGLGSCIVVAADSPTSVNAMESTKLFEPDGTCLRTYIYKNKTYPADSSRKLDGEGLRNILKKNPDAEQLLNNYQARLKLLRWPAYAGSLGVASMISGVIYSSEIESQLGRHDTRYLMIGSGLFLVISSYIYGQFGRHSNEKTLENAIDSYNDSAPKGERIKVDLSPLATGTGGTIQTLVPF